MVIRGDIAALRDAKPIDGQNLIAAAFVRAWARNPHPRRLAAAESLNLAEGIEDGFVPFHGKLEDLVAKAGPLDDDVINFAVVAEHIDRNFGPVEATGEMVLDGCLGLSSVLPTTRTRP